MSRLNWQAVVAGVGGQGVLFVTRVLATAAEKKAASILISEVHGMAQRGGAVVSHLKAGDYKGPLVAAGRADLVLALDAGEALRNLAFLSPQGMLVVNAPDLGFLSPGAQNILSNHGARVVCADANAVAAQAGMLKGVNVAMLGAASAAGALPLETAALEQALSEGLPAKLAKANLKLFKLGAASV